MHCVKCGQFLCNRHVYSLTNCPFCRAAPLKVQENQALRRLVGQIPKRCPNCTLSIRNGDLAVHMNHCRSHSCGANRCEFRSDDKETALRHVIELHGDSLWQKYTRFTAAGISLSLIFQYVKINSIVFGFGISNSLSIQSLSNYNL